MAKNKYLPEEQILERIKALREKMARAGGDDSLAELDKWERKAKKALIFLSLQKHEGIQMVIERANEELKDISQRLLLERPDGSESPEKYALERQFLFDREDLWRWFKSLFVDAETELKMIEEDLAAQETDESEAGNPAHDVGA